MDLKKKRNEEAFDNIGKQKNGSFDGICDIIAQGRPWSNDERLRNEASNRGLERFILLRSETKEQVKGSLVEREETRTLNFSIGWQTQTEDKTGFLSC